MRRPVRTFILAVTASLATVPVGSLQPLPVQADGAAVLHGRLLSEQENRGGVLVQHLDTVDGSQALLPFIPGPAADVSPDGARIAYADVTRDASGVRRDAVLARSASGTTVVLGLLLADGVRWSGDGSYVVASVAGSGGAWSLWRLAPGHAPVKILETPSGGVGSTFDVDPHSNLVTYVRDQDVYGVDAVTGATSRLTHQCSPSGCTGAYAFEALDWSPTGNRLLVRYRETDPTDLTAHDHLGWLVPGQEAPVAIRDFADNEYANSPLVSPDGQLVAWQIESGVTTATGTTQVMGADGGPVTTLGSSHISWQACPGGSCPVFGAATGAGSAPARVGIGRAYAGPAGGRSTARATWRAPAGNGGGAVTSYRLDAMRLSASNRVLGHVTRTVGPSVRAATLALRAGRYRFRVRAVNAAGAGAWSSGSNIVRSR